jgi:subtilisin family serine protease
LWGLDVTPRRHVSSTATPTEAPYGVKLVGAPEAWAAGADGHGLVFGSIDTGTDVTHEALKGNYRGANADGTLSNDYNWADFGSSKSPTPRDFDSHGTHTMGTAVGKGVGVAPAAHWISVHGLADGTDDALKALQWMQAPTKIDGSAPDPTKAPDVVGMSWYMGRNSENLFQESIRNLAAAGIETVKSAGNQGPSAGTITSPGQFPEIIAAAAVDANGKIAGFSSRGPAPWPKGSTTPKPDFAAPGVDVLSSLPGGKYGTMSGTSMAQPHMSGVVLDVLSKYPTLTHAQLMQVLAAGATDGGKPGFDAEYGAGIVNLPKTLAAAQQLVSGTAAPVSASAPAA